MTEGEINRAKAIELLSERLAFARASVELYGLAVERLRRRGGPYDSIRGHLRLMREEKQAHAEWLAEKLGALGGDTGQTLGSALLLRDEWLDIVAGVGPTVQPPQLFEALLKAEVYDGGGWEALLGLAAQSADDEMAGEVRQMLHEQKEHFVYLGRVVARFARSPVLEASP